MVTLLACASTSATASERTPAVYAASSTSSTALHRVSGQLRSRNSPGIAIPRGTPRRQPLTG